MAEAASKSEEDESLLRYGWGKLTSDCLQGMNTIQWFVVWLCVFGFVEGAAVNGLVNIIITTLETRFTLTSSQSGLIVSATDIGAIVVVLFVSYLGGKGHRPRWIAIGCAIMGVGSAIHVLPHFVVGTYDYRAAGETANVSYVCDPGRESTCVQDGSVSVYLYVFMLGQAIHGVGFTPMFTLGTAYVDDNAKTESTALYLGLIYAATALGVGGGYIGGGQLLTLYVDFETNDYVDLTVVDPRWVGAWWVGFVVTAALFLMTTLPLLGFPFNLPGTSYIRAVRAANTDKEDDSLTTWETVLEFPKALFTIIRIPTYTLVVFGACAETLIIGGLAAFAPKILEEKFDILPSESGVIMGAVTLLGGSGGMVLGGLLIRKFRFGVVGMIRLCVLMSLLAILVGGGFFIGCPTVDFAGVSTEYGTNMMTSSVMLDAGCNTGCQCDTQAFEPVCGSDSVLYFTPCHAGCTDDYISDYPHHSKIFNNCTCITERLKVLDPTGSTTGTARTGACVSSCRVMYLFIILLFLGLLLTFTTVTPASMAILRCVPDNLRSLALGLQWASLRLLGTIPGPVLTGSVIDSACALWQEVCGNQGSCWVYDGFELSWRLFLWWTAVKVFSAAIFFLALKVHKHPAKQDFPDVVTMGTDVTDSELESKDQRQSQTVTSGTKHMSE